MTADPAGLPPVAEGLFTWQDGLPHLIGSRCRTCGTPSFPQQTSCPRCSGEDVEVTLLPREGSLWSWTVQRFAPKSPPYASAETEFRPFAVGYVALDGGIAVESRLTGAAGPDGYQIGMPMRLVIEPFPRSDGTTVAAYAFAPLAAGPGPAGTQVRV
jgi:uncharacterized OB-fold protein